MPGTRTFSRLIQRAAPTPTVRITAARAVGSNTYYEQTDQQTHATYNL